jgi:hypothetical protein
LPAQHRLSWRDSLFNAKFDKAIATAPKMRAASTLNDTYETRHETYSAIARFGGRDGLYNFGHLCCLRAPATFIFILMLMSSTSSRASE